MELLCVLLQAFVIALFARIALSWFSPEPGGAMASIERFLGSVVDPILLPVRRMLPRTGMIDFSPMIVALVVQILVMPLVCTG